MVSLNTPHGPSQSRQSKIKNLTACGPPTLGMNDSGGFRATSSADMFGFVHKTHVQHFYNKTSQINVLIRQYAIIKVGGTQQWNLLNSLLQVCGVASSATQMLTQRASWWLPTYPKNLLITSFNCVVAHRTITETPKILTPSQSKSCLTNDKHASRNLKVSLTDEELWEARCATWRFHFQLEELSASCRLREPMLSIDLSIS